MPSALPDGDPAPADGSLPEEALRDLGSRPFGFYVHVPFCTVRCGYCDFNTYTAEELGDGRRAGRRTPRRRSPRSGWPAGCSATCDLPVSTVFFGGGTPTLLPPGDLARSWPRRPRSSGSPTASRSPPSPTRTASRTWDLDALRSGGFTRISFGMQSAVAARAGHARPHPRPAAGARRWSSGRGQAGFDQVSLDLIYGTPGESLADWETSLESALACAPDHVSAYALIVEDGTALARQVTPRRGRDARRRRPGRQVPRSPTTR